MFQQGAGLFFQQPCFILIFEQSLLGIKYTIIRFYACFAIFRYFLVVIVDKRKRQNAYQEDKECCNSTPDDSAFSQVSFVSLPEGVEFQSKHLRHHFHDCPFASQLILDVGGKYFFVSTASLVFFQPQQSFGETFGIDIIGKRFTLDDERNDIIGAPLVNEGLSLLVHPLTLCTAW